MKEEELVSRLDPAALVQAEAILEQLGLPLDTAFNLFLRQIIYHQGLPFAVQLPETAVMPEETPSVPTRQDIEKEIRENLEMMKKSMHIPLADWPE